LCRWWQRQIPARRTLRNKQFQICRLRPCLPRVDAHKRLAAAHDLRPQPGRVGQNIDERVGALAALPRVRVKREARHAREACNVCHDLQLRGIAAGVRGRRVQPRARGGGYVGPNFVEHNSQLFNIVGCIRGRQVAHQLVAQLERVAGLQQLFVVHVLQKGAHVGRVPRAHAPLLVARRAAGHGLLAVAAVQL